MREGGRRQPDGKAGKCTGEHLFVPSQDLRVRHRRSATGFVNDDAVGVHHSIGWDSGMGRRAFEVHGIGEFAFEGTRKVDTVTSSDSSMKLQTGGLTTLFLASGIGNSSGSIC